MEDRDIDKVIVLDFGGQYCHLISRRIKDLGVYSEIIPPENSIEKIKAGSGIKGIILSGGAASVYENKSPKINSEILELGIPILGICYGHQLIAHLINGKVGKGETGEYGLMELKIKSDSKLFEGINKEKETTVWMNHKDKVLMLKHGYFATASTDNVPIAAFENSEKKIFGVQFHPEVTHTEKGTQILKNFVINICGANKNWNMDNFIEKSIAEAKAVIGKEKALIGLSGGIDSSVATIILSKAIGKNVTAAYIDTGLMREGETDFIRKTFSEYDINLKIIDAKERFFKRLKGVFDPETKRKVIGKTFIEVFEDIAKKVGAKFLVQGTIYSDRIESGATAHSSVIKSHHNVGGLPEKMNMIVYEPLRDLYKDEVRKTAAKLKLPKEIVSRHIFPGPGLGVRILGEITPKKAEITRKASSIIEEELKKKALYEKQWMAFAVLLPIKSVGIQGDSRSYKQTIAIRIITSKDAMTARFSKIPFSVLETISSRITNEIQEINRVVYDITNKPPSTMEWE